MRFLKIFNLVMLLVCCKSETATIDASSNPKLIEVKDAFSFKNQVVASDSLNIISYLYFYNGGGIAVGDINNDSLLDIYFTSNTGDDALYLNLGNLKFKDVTNSSGLGSNPGWSTGASFTDIDMDGDLDLYVCKLGGVAPFTGSNKLYINDGRGNFTEQSKDYGLDFSTLSTQAAFFDADGDGDLDCYLLTHSIHDTERLISGLNRKSEWEHGDRFLIRTGSHSFVDKTKESGIYNSRIGYGLGIAIADLSSDGLPDIYVSNDFSEGDYFYVNQGDGKFKELSSAYFSHSSEFSMGSSVRDLNSDGRLDIMTLDMRPSHDSIRKSTFAGASGVMQANSLRRNFKPQFARNSMHVSIGSKFVDIAPMLGLHSSDWSWSPAIFDLDLDGNDEIIVANGIVQRPNDLDYLKYTSSLSLQRKMSDLKIGELMPNGKVNNLLFDSYQLRGSSFSADTITFESISSSTGVIVADFDLDGDEDVVFSNVNQKAQLFENTTRKTNILNSKSFSFYNNDSLSLSSSVSFSLSQNDFVKAFTVQPVTGFQSSYSGPILASVPNPDSAFVIEATWPSGYVYRDTLIGNKFKCYEPIYGDGVLRDGFKFQGAIEEPSSFSYNYFQINPVGIFANWLEHDDRAINAYDLSNYTLVDTLIDDMYRVIVKCSEKIQKSIVSISKFSKQPREYILPYVVRDLQIEELKGDEFLLFALADVGFIPNSLSSNGIFLLSRKSNPDIFINTGVDRPLTGVSYVDSNSFIVVSPWSPIYNLRVNEHFLDLSVDSIGPTGLWQSCFSLFANHSNYIVISNLGLNTLIKEHDKQNLELHVADYDRNGSLDPILVREENGTRSTFFGLDELSEQMPLLKKFFTSYLPFSSSTFDEMFPKELKQGESVYRVQELRNVVFDLKEKRFYTFPFYDQLGPIVGVEVLDSSFYLRYRTPICHPQIGAPFSGVISKDGLFDKSLIPFIY